MRTSILIPYGIITVVAAFAWRYAFDADAGFVTRRSAQHRPGLAHRRGWLVRRDHLTEVWKTTPFMALLLLAGLALVPDELHEAAKVDGASAWQRFWRITCR